MRLEIRATSAAQAQAEAERLHAVLSNRIAEERRVETSLVGPAPCFHPRLDNLHRWHVIVRGPDPASLVAELRSTEDLYIDVDPVSLL